MERPKKRYLYIEHLSDLKNGLPAICSLIDEEELSSLDLDDLENVVITPFLHAVTAVKTDGRLRRVCYGSDLTCHCVIESEV